MNRVTGRPTNFEMRSTEHVSATCRERENTWRLEVGDGCCEVKVDAVVPFLLTAE